MADLQEALDRAVESEARKVQALGDAAVAFATEKGNFHSLFDNLKAAAKTWTNAHHELSRCKKHVREAKR